MPRLHFSVGEESDRSAQTCTRSNILQLGHAASFIPTSMNLPSQLQQEVEKWASRQGISLEQFILQAITEKVTALNQQNTETTASLPQAVQSSTFQQPKIYRKEGILVVETEPINNLDINAFIDELREERIQEQMAW